jgi:hypothetical protein
VLGRLRQSQRMPVARFFVAPPPFSGVLILVISFPQPELASGSHPADKASRSDPLVEFQPLPKLVLGSETPMVSTDIALVISSAALFGLGWILRMPLPVVLCCVPCSLSPFLDLRALRRILWWLSLLTPLPRPLTWGKGVVWIWICFRRRSYSIVLLSSG